MHYLLLFDNKGGFYLFYCVVAQRPVHASNEKKLLYKARPTTNYIKILSKIFLMRKLNVSLKMLPHGLGGLDYNFVCERLELI